MLFFCYSSSHNLTHQLMGQFAFAIAFVKNRRIPLENKAIHVPVTALLNRALRFAMTQSTIIFVS